MQNRKLGKRTDQRMSMLKGQVTALLWYGKIETTVDRAREVSSMAEKLLTKAIDTYADIESKVETRKNAKGQDIKVEVQNDGPKKLAARRAIMAKLHNMQEIKQQGEKNADFKKRTKGINHPLIEKIFNEYAPKYEQRAIEVGNRGGYTRVIKIGQRRGDNAEMAIIELV